MYKTSAKQLLNRKLNLKLITIYANKSTNNEKAIEEFKTDIKTGPQLSDFMSGVITREDHLSDSYNGKLKREKGDNDRYKAFNELI